MKKYLGIFLAVVLGLMGAFALADESSGTQATPGIISGVTVEGTVTGGTIKDSNGTQTGVIDVDSNHVLSVISGTATVQTEKTTLVLEQGATFAFDNTNKVITLTGNATLSTDGKSNERVVISGNGTYTLDNAAIVASADAGIKILPSVKDAVIKLVGTNNVTGSSGYAGIEVGWESESNFASVTINGDGELSANGGSNSAGIGGSKSNTGLYGNITIDSGTIHANASGNGAAIGSSENENAGKSNGSFKPTDQGWGTIIINGGAIVARASGTGAGIGGGNHMDSGLIIINGGSVDAKGASGIGTGLGSHQTSSKSDLSKGPGYYFATIEINGGSVTGESNGGKYYMGAGIGGAAQADATIIINGGTVVGRAGSCTNAGRYYDGGAGIGGGYEGHAHITINDGTVRGYGSDGASGIGSGGSPNKNENRTGDKGYASRRGQAKYAETVVTVNAGSVFAYAGPYGGAGLGAGVGADKATIRIHGGRVEAVGSKSNSNKKAGGSGVGSGAEGLALALGNQKYYYPTEITIDITGGTVIATGGWGASGIGSGAEAEGQHSYSEKASITISGGKVEAYADGTKFAIDTRNLHEDGTTTSITNGRNISRNILQGTFVHEYTDAGITQNPEGLKPIVVANDDTGASLEQTGMPGGYRSFAISVSGTGTYTVYTDAASIGEGGGRYFAKTLKEVYAKSETGDIIQYTVNGGLSDNFYLFPVKTVKVEKKIVAEDEADIAGLNGEFSFALRRKSDRQYWGAQKTITIKNGVPQGKAYFVSVPDGEYDILEMDGDTPMSVGTLFGTLELRRITTQHNEGTDNNGIISSTQWSDGITVTNTFGPQTITVSGTKTWVDADNQDGLRPASITVNLLADGAVVRTQTVMPDASGVWSYSFTNLPVYSDGRAIVYTVSEEPVPGYTAEVSGMDLINTHIPETVNITGVKTWNDADNQDGIRPANIRVNLLANGTQIRTATVTGTTNRWNFTFEDLPRFEGGAEIAYTVTEAPVAGYTTAINGTTITNTHVPEVVTISGTKTWNDDNNEDGIRPDSITVNLLADGRKVDSRTVLGGGSYTFENLNRYERGREIRYTIEEEPVAGYTAEVSGYNLINTHVPERVEISGTKTWADHDNRDGLRPQSVTVNLMADGTQAASQTVTGEGNVWSYSFTNLPGYRNGRKIVYTVTENPVAEYETSIIGTNIYNIHQSQDAEPERYTVTIRYWADGAKAFPDFNGTYNFGEKYDVTSPAKPGYTVDKALVAGIVYENTVIDVYYTPNTVNLSVFYQYLDGSTAADPHFETLHAGDRYSVVSPVIEGYTASIAVVEGTMPGQDLQVIVWYRPDTAEENEGRVPLGDGTTMITEYGVPLGLGDTNRNAGECYD